MLDTGDQAPNFSLPGTAPPEYDDIVEYELSRALSEQPVLLNFYLFDFHPACRENVCELHDLSWFDLDANVTVYGISTDSAHSHVEFAKQEALEYPLLSDSDGRVADSYGVLAADLGGHRRVSHRSVFVIDRSGTIQYSWIAQSPPQQPNWTEIKQVVDGLKKGPSIE
jgi:peroxiredoxin